MLNDGPDPQPPLAAGEFPHLSVPIGELIDLLHVTHAPEVIEEYRLAILRGDRFPPLSVIRLAGRYFIADGHKRYSAYRALAQSHVEVEVWTTRRWLADQLGQLRRKLTHTGAVLWGSLSDGDARRQARRLFWDTVGHWQRIGRSLLAHLKRR